MNDVNIILYNAIKSKIVKIWKEIQNHFNNSTNIHNIYLVWSSSWVRTLFFNPIQPDEQDSKPSPRVRAFELAQSSGSNRVWSLKSTRRTELSVQFNSSNKILGPILGLIAQPEIFVWAEIRIECSTNKYACSIQLVERNAVFDSTRRTKTRTRSTRSAKSACPVQLVELRHCVQLCSNLGLNARARVQLNSTITLHLLYSTND